MRLGDYFGEKPVILVLAYFAARCSARRCSMGWCGTARYAVRPRQDFRVVTVSFDPSETPADGRRQEADLPRALRPTGSGGRLALPDRRAIRSPADRAVGFHYVYDHDSDQFAHASGIWC